MAYEYSKRYIIRQISSDGLLRVVRISEGYGYYSSLDDEFETEAEAYEYAVKKDVGDVVILTVCSSRWVSDDKLEVTK